jgi:NAD(P)-dependent dehydrogenase (short-subunit alcohol dehydrogenase family)
MVKKVMDEFGKIDILINNAAVISFAPFVDLAEEEWDRIMNINLKGAFLCCKYVLPHMIARKSGKIVNIGSVDAMDPTQMHIHYCVSKAGMEMLTKALAKEMAVHNINVNCIGPGSVWTPMLENAASIFCPDMDPRQYYEALAKNISLFGREVTVEDIANTMLFLVSEESRNLTGYTIYVDGGFIGVSAPSQK